MSALGHKRKFYDLTNENLKSFNWSAAADTIIKKINREEQALKSEH